MKFLADADTPRILVEALSTNNHEVFWAVTEPRTKDLELIQKATRESRVIITFDKGFGELVFKHGHSTPVVLIRPKIMSLSEAVSMTVAFIERESDGLLGFFCVVEDDRIRKTPLP